MIKDDKPVKKLKLDSETLRVLDTGELAGIQGGVAAGFTDSISFSVSVGGCPKCCGCNNG